MKAWVTGGTRGIGAAVALRLLEDGYHVIATGSEVDVRSGESVNNFLTAHEPIDLIVHCAAVNRGEWEEILDTNLLGTINVAGLGAWDMALRGSGRIVVMCGGGVGGRNQSDNIPYLVSKTGVVAYVEAASKILKGFGVAINAVSPGNVRTDMNPTAVDGPEDVCKLVSWLAADTSGLTGKFLSAKWDDYKKTPDVLRAINTSNLWTLRRVT